MLLTISWGELNWWKAPPTMEYYCGKSATLQRGSKMRQMDYPPSSTHHASFPLDLDTRLAPGLCPLIKNQIVKNWDIAFGFLRAAVEFEFPSSCEKFEKVSLFLRSHMYFARFQIVSRRFLLNNELKKNLKKEKTIKRRER